MNTVVNRNNFAIIWLEPARPSADYTKFKHAPVKEKEGARESIKAALTEAILDHHLHRRVIEGALKRLGFPGAAQHLSSLLPKEERIQKGNFGEVVASEHLRQRYGYEMPVFKLRYMDTPKMPMRGEDIIAFVMERDRIMAICVGEAKTLEHFERSKVKEAHDRLSVAYHPHPTSLPLISNVLHIGGEHDLAEQVDAILETLASKDFPRHNWIFLITGNKPRKPFHAIQESESVVEDLHCVNLHLRGLSSFVSELFNNPLRGP